MIPAHDRRLMLVHAHPDDETIANGATMARLAAEGGLVTLVTCTLGEEGEVLVPDSSTSARSTTTRSRRSASASSPTPWACSA